MEKLLILLKTVPATGLQLRISLMPGNGMIPCNGIVLNYAFVLYNKSISIAVLLISANTTCTKPPSAIICAYSF